MTLEFRPIQERAMDAFFEDFGKGYQHILGVMPTGFGKTIVAGGITTKLLKQDRTSFLIAHRDVLLEQARSKIRYVCESYGLNPKDVDIVTKENNARKYKIAIASVNAAKNWSHGLSGRNLLITDECHHATAAGYRQFFEQFNAANDYWYGLGLTATAFRTDKGEYLGDIYERVSFHTDLATMIRKGYLTPLRCRQIKMKGVEIERLEKKNGDYTRASLNKVINTEAFNKAVARETKRNAPNGRMIVFAVSLDHCVNLVTEFENVGIKARMITYHQSKKEQMQTYKDFEDGLFQALVSITKLTEGYDDPAVDTVVFVRPTLSPILWIQGVGRGLRLYPGKKECLVLDFTDNSTRLSLSMAPRLFSDEEEHWEKDQDPEDEIMDEEEDEEFGDNFLEDPNKLLDEENEEDDPTTEELMHREDNGDLVLDYENEVDLINTDFAWTHYDDDWVLSLGIDEGSLIIHRQEMAKSYDLYRMVPNERPQQILVSVDRSFAMMAAHDIAVSVGSEYSQKDAMWRSLPVTPKQVEILNRYGRKDRLGTRGLASDMISLLFFRQFIAAQVRKRA